MSQNNLLPFHYLYEKYQIKNLYIINFLLFNNYLNVILVKLVNCRQKEIKLKTQLF